MGRRRKPKKIKPLYVKIQKEVPPHFPVGVSGRYEGTSF